MMTIFTEEETSPKELGAFPGPTEVNGRGGPELSFLDASTSHAARMKYTVSGCERSSRQSTRTCRLQQWFSEHVSVSRGQCKPYIVGPTPSCVIQEVWVRAENVHL